LLYSCVIDFDSAAGCLQHVDVHSVADVSEVHAVFIFNVETNWVAKCSCMYALLVRRSGVLEEMGVGALSGPIGTFDRDKFCHVVLLAQ
jgi:hypothetical protein